MTEVARVQNDLQPLIVRSQIAQDFHRGIGRSVIDENDLVVVLRQRAEDRVNARNKFLKVLLLVQATSDDADLSPFRIHSSGLIQHSRAHDQFRFSAGPRAREVLQSAGQTPEQVVGHQQKGKSHRDLAISDVGLSANVDAEMREIPDEKQFA